ncbi:2-amino-4-hydroxy-6-hydroxymethyldihydropteridine diphosphokinase [Microvirga sp. G4-2]|uniref:2-amino-4-hydroxy-6- hydroxymethyldihydropteridine diphosphokinase n=1 Tax=Microvirga sp. G4-2 TaxID=3434467 RepID=UPI004043B731
MARAALSLGGNLGDKRANIAQAIAALERNGVTVLARSADYLTEPWGPVEQDRFVNACVMAETTLAPAALLSLCLQIERELGRIREVKWGPRIIDIDVLTYDDLEINEPDLTLPHPHMLERLFVLVPLAEIAPDLVVRGQRITDIIKALPPEDMRRLD